MPEIEVTQEKMFTLYEPIWNEFSGDPRHRSESYRRAVKSVDGLQAKLQLKVLYNRLRSTQGLEVMTERDFYQWVGLCEHERRGLSEESLDPKFYTASKNEIDCAIKEAGLGVISTYWGLRGLIASMAASFDVASWCQEQGWKVIGNRRTLEVQGPFNAISIARTIGRGGFELAALRLTPEANMVLDERGALAMAMSWLQEPCSIGLLDLAGFHGLTDDAKTAIKAGLSDPSCRIQAVLLPGEGLVRGPLTEAFMRPHKCEPNPERNPEEACTLEGGWSFTCCTNVLRNKVADTPCKLARARDSCELDLNHPRIKRQRTA